MGIVNPTKFTDASVGGNVSQKDLTGAGGPEGRGQEGRCGGRI